VIPAKENWPSIDWQRPSASLAKEEPNITGGAVVEHVVPPYTNSWYRLLPPVGFSLNDTCPVTPPEYPVRVVAPKQVFADVVCVNTRKSSEPHDSRKPRLPGVYKSTWRLPSVEPAGAPSPPVRPDALERGDGEGESDAEAHTGAPPPSWHTLGGAQEVPQLYGEAATQ